MLKNKLLNLNLVIDNEYLDKYCDIINNGASKKIKYISQVHHIVPKYYFLYNNLPVDNTKENKIVLTHRNHLLAHYYLAKCSSTDKYKVANIEAIKQAFNNPYARTALKNNISELLDDYDELCFFANQYKSEKYKGTKHIHKNDVEKRVHLNELEFYLNSGWLLGRSDKTKKSISVGSMGKQGTFKGKTHTQEFKNHISILYKDRKYINKDGIVKSVTKNDLDNYLNNGWKLGNPNNGRAVNTRAWINNNTINKLVKIENIDDYLNTGWKRGRKKVELNK